MFHVPRSLPHYTMSFTETLLLVIRWLHAIAAVAWVGGGIFYLLVLRPHMRHESSSGNTGRSVGEEFRALVNTAMGILLVTGAILSFSRLTSGFVGIPYMTVLAIKIALAFYMFYLVRFLRRRTYPEDASACRVGLRRLVSILTSTTTILVLGVIIFLLSDILQALIEKGLRG